MPRWPQFLFALALAAGASAQLTHVIPNGMAAMAGAGSNYFPWGTLTFFPGVRLLACYDSANFTAAGITTPIAITRLRWRANESPMSWSSASFQNATVALATAQFDCRELRADWTSNYGPDLTQCYAGTVNVQAGSANGGIGPFHVDVPLTTPFYYDPMAGDLCIETSFPSGSFTGGNVPQVDVDGRIVAGASRVFASPPGPAVNGVNVNHGPVIEVTYQPAGPATALASWFGAGCGESAASFYELFAAGTFDLSNRGIRMVPFGSGYVVVTGAGPWFTPTSQPLALGDNQVTGLLALGFQLPTPAGMIGSILVSSNGFVWAAPSADAGCCSGDTAMLLSRQARWCPLWTDLIPNASGTVHFDRDPSTSAAYVTFVGVPEVGTANANTFQVALFPNGQVEFRYGNCAVQNHATVVGWSPGNAARDPGSIDLSTALPVVVGPDRGAMFLSAGSRPIVGTSTSLTASRIPPGSPLGGFVGGMSRYLPGIDLGGIGMPGCSQSVSMDATTFFTPFASSASLSLPIPNSTVLNGAQLHFQAATLTVGVNPLGAVSSNGITLRIGRQ